MTPEGRIKKRVKELLDSASCHHFWPVQNGMGSATLDCITARPSDGHVLAIETKAPGERPTARQKATARDMMARGWLVVIYDGDRFMEGLLGAWLANDGDSPGITDAIRKRTMAIINEGDERTVL